MKFQFTVNLNDTDYLEFNKFHMLRSPYGEKTLRNTRASIYLIFGIFILLALFVGYLLESLPYTLIVVLALIVACAFYQIRLPHSMGASLKKHIARLQKSGKAPYSPHAELAFYEDHFTETTETAKSEVSYAALERISVVDRKYIYLHVNSLSAYLLPTASFASEEQYNAFLAFAKTVCPCVEVYDKEPPQEVLL